MQWKKLDNPRSREMEGFRKEYCKKARFILDKNCPPVGKMLLASMGYNAVHVDDVGLSSKPDEDVFNFARKSRRMVITKDKGYLDNRKYPFKINPGIIIIPDCPLLSDVFFNSIRIIDFIIGKYYKLYSGYKIQITESFEIIMHKQKNGRVTKSKYRLGANNASQLL